MQNVRESVLYAVEYAGGWPPKNLLEFRQWLDEHIESIPEEHRADATIEINSETSYDSHNATIHIEYTRPETAQEADEREKRRLTEREDAIARKVAELERLMRGL